MGWSSFPPEHKKSFYCGLSLYVLCLCAVIAWVYVHADDARDSRQARTLHTTVAVSTVYTGAETTASPVQHPPVATTASAAPLPATGKGAVTIVMTGLGLSQDMTAHALKALPATVTLAFSPYSPALQSWLHEAAEEKRTSLIMVPMEPMTYPKDDPGPLALLTRIGADENAKHLAFILDHASGTTGVINQMGSAFLGDKKNMYAFLSTLRQRNDIFVENPAGGIPQATDLAAQTDVPYLSADLTIDAAANERDIRQALLDLEKIARRRGYALGIAHPYPVTIDTLETWATQTAQSGIELVTPQTLIRVQAEKTQESAKAPVPAQPEPVSGGAVIQGDVTGDTVSQPVQATP